MVDAEGNVTEDPSPSDFDPASFGIRKLSLIMAHIAEPGSSGSNVVFVRTRSTTMVVDSGGPNDRERVIEGFLRNRLIMEKVNVLVSTSIDEHHSSNDDLFPHALHHLKKEDWFRVKGANPRRVIINTAYHWIDKYLKIVKVRLSDEERLAVLVHFPSKEELIEPGSRFMAGKVVGILGASLPSASDPEASSIIARVREERACGKPRRTEASDLEGLLGCCDIAIPGQGGIVEIDRTPDQKVFTGPVG